MPITLRRKTLDEMKKDAVSGNSGEGYKKGGMVKKPAAKKPMGYAKGGMAFKPCAGCPNAAKCKAMGKCMAKSKK